MKKLLKNYGFVKIYEEQDDGRVIISAKDDHIEQILVTYKLDGWTNDPTRQAVFRNIAMNYFQEIKGRFGSN